MFRGLSSICIFCESHNFINASKVAWRPNTSVLNTAKAFQGSCETKSRSLTRLAHKRRPAHLELSSRVAQSNLKTSDDGSRTKSARRRQVEGPFASMNQTVARIRDNPREDSLSRYQRDGEKGRKSFSKRPGDEYKALKERQALIRVNYGQRTAVKRSLESIDSFSDFGLLPDVQHSISKDVLRGLAVLKPSPVQKLAIPALLKNSIREVVEIERMQGNLDRYKAQKMEAILIAAETGSGKTLAYLAPVINSLKILQEQEREMENMEKKKEEEAKSLDLFELKSPPLSDENAQVAGKPRVIVLVPSAELVDQIGGVAKTMSHQIKFRASLISSAYTPKVIRNRLFQPGGIDLLVSTPQLLANIVKSNASVLSRVTHLVVDEADSLLDKSFVEYTGAIIERATPTLRQLVMCSATIPRRMDSYLRKHYPEAERLTTPNLHAVPRRVQLAMLDVDRGKYHGNKNLACADLIWSIGSNSTGFDDQTGPHLDVSGQNVRSRDENRSDDMSEVVKDAESNTTKRIIVFVNEREHAVQLSAYLRTMGIDAVGLNRDTATRLEKHDGRLGDFSGRPPTKAPERPESIRRRVIEGQPAGIAIAPLNGKLLQDTKVLVVTDLASRGIDTTQVRHVILYDVPHSSIDFIHRLGRTGRMGRRGKATVLVGKGDRRDVVSEVREGMFKGQALI
jgi:ATP-dependent RNA helicase MRH4, mitochondrial